MDYPDLGQGRKGNLRIERPVTSKEELQDMSSAEIMTAYKAGLLNELLGKDPHSD